MSETKDYIVQKQEAGSVLISQEVILEIVALAVKEVDGVAALYGSLGSDIAGKLGMKNLSKGIKVIIKDNTVSIECGIIAKYGFAVVEVAKNVQTAIADAIDSMTGLHPEAINVNVCGIAAADR